jgi:hypothetical protein
MPLLFYGRLHDGKRKLYSKDLREIETSVFDNFKVRHLAPYGERVRELANLWWFEDRKHTAVSWNESRMDLNLPHGVPANESIFNLREQTVFMPGLIRHIEALEIIRVTFPKWLVPSPLVLRFNNQDEVYTYHD